MVRSKVGLLAIATTVIGCGLALALTNRPALWWAEVEQLTAMAAIAPPPVQSLGPGQSVRELQPSAGSVPSEGLATAIGNLAWSPEGDQLAMGKLNGSFVIWDGQTGQPQWQGQLSLKSDAAAEQQDLMLLALSWSPDGQTLASSNGEAVYLWDTATGRLKYSFHPTPSGSGLPLPIALAWSPDGQTLATGGFGTVQLWNSNRGKLQQTLFTPETRSTTLEGTLPQGVISSVSWSPDGMQLAIAAEDSSIQLWNSQTQQIERRIRSGQGWIEELSWSSDGQRWAVLGDVIRLKLWDATQGTALQTLSGFEGEVSSLSWRPNHQSLAIALNDGSLELWDATSGTVQQTLEQWQPPEPPVSNVVSWSPDGRTLAVGQGDRLRLWQIAPQLDSPLNHINF